MSPHKYLKVIPSSCSFLSMVVYYLLALWLLGGFLLLPIQEGFGISSYAF